MNKFLILSIILLKNTFMNVNSSKKNYKKYLIFFAFSPIVISIYSLVSKTYQMLFNIEQEGLILAMGFSIVSMAIFYFGIFFMVSLFYFSSDTETLLFLPFRAYQIIGAKFVVALVYEYLTEGLLLGPVIIGFGITSKAGILYYLYSSIIFVLLPILPLILAGVISMIVMRFTNIFKNRDKFRMVGGVVSIILAVSLNLSIQKFSNNNLSADNILSIINEGDNSLLMLSSKLFPSVQIAVQSIINFQYISGLIYILLFILVNIIGIFIFLFIGESIYLKSILNLSNSVSRAKTLDISSINIQVHSKIFAYFQKEIRIIFRTPAYFMNCVIMNFLWPLFLVIPFMFDNTLAENISKANILISLPQFHGIIIACALSLGIFMSSSNSITSTSISRDGSTFFVNKYLPLPYIEQIFAKIITGILLSILGTTLIFIVISFALTIPIYLGFFAILFALLGIFIGSMFGIVLDIFSPKLIWDNEQKAVKQNLNVLFHTLFGFICGFGVVFIVYFFNLNILKTIILLFLISLAAILSLYYFLVNSGTIMYEKIDG